MALRCLLLTQDLTLKVILRRALDSLRIEAEAPAPHEGVLELITTDDRFNAVILDFDEPLAVDLMRLLSKHGSKTIRIAVLRQASAVPATFKLGAHFILYKPLSQEQANHGMRAAKSLMHPMPERRYRQRTHHPVQISFDNLHMREATMLDLSLGGMAIKLGEPLRTARRISLRFNLPGGHTGIHANGELAWEDTRGRAGIRFIALPAQFQHEINRWLWSASGGKAGEDHTPLKPKAQRRK